MSTFVTVLKSGGCYDPAWVANLNRQARLHLKPERIVCLTDMPVMDCETIPMLHNWPGWFSKIELFRPGLFRGPVFYVDLDSLILAPIPELWETIAFHEHLLMLDDFYQPRIPASGVMGWVPSVETERIYAAFAAKPEIHSSWSKGDGAYIGRHPHARLQLLLPGVFYSFKAHKLESGPGCAKVVCLHGKPKFNDLEPSHWMYRAWVGMPNAQLPDAKRSG